MPRFAIPLLLITGIATVAHAQPADSAQARAKELKAGIKSFRLQLNYNGDEDKPFYRLSLKVSAVDPSSPFRQIASITEKQAEKIIDHLAGDGFLTGAIDLRNKTKAPRPNMLGYTLTVGHLYEDLGWGLPMLKRLDRLRKVLDGDAAHEMDFLLTRLSGFRTQWIDRLIRQLADDKLEVREAATKKLTELGETAYPMLKETLQRADLDTEARSRIKIVLGEKANEGRTVTDPASGVTVAISGDGHELTATRGGNIVWKTRWTGAKAVTVGIEAGLVVVSPENVAFDPATGKMMSKR